MPADNDWVLNGLGFEPSLIRDYLCYNLSRMMGEYASRTVYCEVMINGSYNGLYVLQEKIKQGSDRVNVMKIATTDNASRMSPEGISQKLIKQMRMIRLPGQCRVMYPNDDVTFIHTLPKPEDVTPQQNDYIHSQFLLAGQYCCIRQYIF